MHLIFVGFFLAFKDKDKRTDRFFSEDFFYALTNVTKLLFEVTLSYLLYLEETDFIYLSAEFTHINVY
jgi:hypothetical protein